MRRNTALHSAFFRSRTSCTLPSKNARAPCLARICAFLPWNKLLVCSSTVGLAFSLGRVRLCTLPTEKAASFSSYSYLSRFLRHCTRPFKKCSCALSCSHLRFFTLGQTTCLQSNNINNSATFPQEKYHFPKGKI